MLMYLIIIGLLIANLSFGNSKALEVDNQRGRAFGHASQFGKQMEAGRVLQQTDTAINNLLTTAVSELKVRGFQELATQIESDWNSRYRGFVYELPNYHGVGDHPGIVWMLSVHSQIESVLGLELCKALRLHDIWTLAYTIPVVIKCVDAVDTQEYSLHFVPFCGVVSYWVSYGICLAATSGGGIAFACGLLGDGVEMLVVRFIAPRLSPKFWTLACQSAQGVTP